MPKKSAEKRRGRPPKEKEPIDIPEGLPTGKVSEINIRDIAVEDSTFEFRVAYKVSDLKRSIKAEGLQFPVILRGKDKPYQLVSGFRRLRACRELEMPKIKAIIREDLSDEEAHRLSWLENEIKKTLTPMDKAHAIEKLKSQGKKTEEIAKLFSLSKRQIERYQQIADYPEILKKALKNDDILFKHALLLVQALKKSPKLDLKAWLETIEKDALSAEELKKRLSKETRKVSRPKKFLEKRKDGFRLFPFALTPETPDAERKKMSEALKAALQLLENA